MPTAAATKKKLRSYQLLKAFLRRLLFSRTSLLALATDCDAGNTPPTEVSSCEIGLGDCGTTALLEKQTLIAKNVQGA